MEALIIVSIAISFFVTYLTLPLWIRKAKQLGLVWNDMHKLDKTKKVSGSGGIMVVMGFVLGALIYIALQTFYFKSYSNTIEIFGLLTAFLLVSGIGLVDDLFGWRKGGLSKRSRLILLVFSAIPLMVINAGTSTMSLPFIGAFNFGLLFPLLIVPLGVVGTTATFNFLAGYNGLEASQGIILLGGLAVATYLTGNPWLSVIALYGIAALFAFYLFNFHPAKVFPGDVLTYPIGALIAYLAILGNIEKVALFFFIPNIIEVVLKSRGKLVKSSFGKLNSQGFLEEPYSKIYGLEHLAIRILKKVKKNVRERDVVFLINGFQILLVIIGFLIFF